MPFRTTCGMCGARRVDAQLGLEQTPEEYVARMVEVFREVRRVLTEDGTLWLNMGDSYAGAGPNRASDKRMPGASTEDGDRAVRGCKAKDLIGIPWRVALALQADGWWLRSDIIWSKSNPMPESVTDRPTKSHEYVFLLTESAHYYYDAEAIAEPSIHAGRVVRTNGADGMRSEHFDGRTRNARTVWEIATQPYPHAHFATFPEELARRCIVAGSAPGDLVLDIFGGSGTVAQVATGNGRSAIHIDLNPGYIELARQRIGPLLVADL